MANSLKIRHLPGYVWIRRQRAYFHGSCGKQSDDKGISRLSTVGTSIVPSSTTSTWSLSAKPASQISTWFNLRWGANDGANPKTATNNGFLSTESPQRDRMTHIWQDSVKQTGHQIDGLFVFLEKHKFEMRLSLAKYCCCSIAFRRSGLALYA